MFGSSHPLDAPFDRPVRFFLRLGLVGVALLWFAKEYSAGIVISLLPAIRAEMTSIDADLSILSLQLARENGRDTVRMRANLSHPDPHRDSPIYPRGQMPHTEGWYQIDLNAFAVFQSLLILLAAILSWPLRSCREFVLRMLVAAPLMVGLFAVDTPLQLLGNFQEAVIRHVDAHGKNLLFQWDTFLEGGGSAALALAFGAVAISLGARTVTPQAAQRSRTNTAPPRSERPGNSPD